MNITVLCVGKVKEAFMREGIDEYSKRLGRYIKMKIVEVQDEKTPENASGNENIRIINTEGERILSKIRDTDYVCALAINGKTYSSEEFSDYLARVQIKSKGNLVFVIGGSLGLSDAVIRRADDSISFSRMTFPHQLMRMILLEQIYRGYRILNNEPYHK
ncbi:MAG: 23S rRNA (pseudouridine(1915)-N(3))-methyltransferase RlmH [Lachnospiraceae bacterium]|nr:23S rRNA (pseudouridine(1915)-N(3))-methyltransferase RlmH [Lachnospiraceae bacterium]